MGEFLNPDMLVMARYARGKTQSELASETGIAQSRISKIEDGVVKDVEVGELEKIGEKLQFPPDFFQQTGAMRATCASFYRKKSALPVKHLNKCDALMNIQLLHLQWLQGVARANSSEDSPAIAERTQSAPIEVARRLRREWGIPNGPVDDLVKAAEKNGFVIILFDFDTPKLDGISIRAHDGTPTIFLNPSFPADRRRFTLAHEIGHLVMHLAPTAEMESEADEFAAEFLMPAALVRHDLAYPLSLEKLATMKVKWKVSMQALLKRAQTLNLVNERYSRYLWMQMGRCGYRRDEPFSDRMPSEAPTAVSKLVRRQLDRLNGSVRDLAASIHLSPEECRALYLTEAGRSP